MRMSRHGGCGTLYFSSFRNPAFKLPVQDAGRNIATFGPNSSSGQRGTDMKAARQRSEDCFEVWPRPPSGKRNCGLIPPNQGLLSTFGIPMEERSSTACLRLRPSGFRRGQSQFLSPTRCFAFPSTRLSGLQLQHTRSWLRRAVTNTRETRSISLSLGIR